MSSKDPVSPENNSQFNKERKKDDGVIEANEEEEKVAVKRRRDDDEGMVAGRVRSAVKAQSAEETSPERASVARDMAKLEEEAAKFE